VYTCPPPYRWIYEHCTRKLKKFWKNVRSGGYWAYARIAVIPSKRGNVFKRECSSKSMDKANGAHDHTRRHIDREHEDTAEELDLLAELDYYLIQELALK